MTREGGYGEQGETPLCPALRGSQHGGGRGCSQLVSKIQRHQDSPYP